LNSSWSSLFLDYHSLNFVSLDWIGPINYNSALAWLCGYKTSDKSFTLLYSLHIHGLHFVSWNNLHQCTLFRRI
jgi:hypothetical protein